MPTYLLSVHAGAQPQADHEQSDHDPEAMQAMMQPILELEQRLADTGAWVFSGNLTDPGSATVVRAGETDHAITDGPYAESKEHIAGFYVIDAADLDEALDWAGQVTDCIGMPIEVRPFAATGRMADQFS